MNAALLKHYGTIFLTILILGLGAYFRTDLTALLPGADEPEVVVEPAPVSPDAGL